MDPVESTVKQYILDQFLPGEDPANLKSDTPLISGGVLDSLATLKLVSFLEQQFSIMVGAHEAGVANFDTVADIAKLVRQKQAAAR
jgi:acyl carrier protein